MSLPTQRTEPRQVADRVNHEFAEAAAILDEGLMAHVGFAVEGQPFVIPMTYAREGEHLYLHGASVSRLMKRLGEGLEVCVTVTHLDGMVLARSTFGHSMNYRSVMIFGQARWVDDAEEKDRALKQLVHFLVPGRNDEARAADAKELNATAFLSLPIKEFSVKRRSGPPQDPAKDMSVETWTGEVPLRTVAEAPVDDPTMLGDHNTPDYAIDYLNKRLAALKE